MKLLLHVCCGPCALYPIEKMLGAVSDRPLHSKKFDKITGFFYNPNIHPPSEYKRRKDALIHVGANGRTPLQIIVPPYKMEEYFTEVFSNVGANGRSLLQDRCPACWKLRLEKTANFAKDNGFDAFTTTLLISPYQDHEKVKEIGENIASEKGIQFYYQDFRPGFRDGQEQAKKENLYRQKYCGCVFSELERVKV